MKTEVIHDYNRMPEEEIQNSVQAIKKSGNYKLLGVDRIEDKLLGAERVNLGVVIYEDA